MNDIAAIPTVEQINLEHRLAHSKVNEAVQHATNCGLMLLQIKASKAHGEWLPWLNGEIEAGRLEVKRSQANTYMRVASNYQRAGNLEGVTSIRAALEWLSDKDDVKQGELIPADIEAERKAREEAESKAESERQAREQAEQRREKDDLLTRISNDQMIINSLRNKLKDLESKKPEVVEKAPDDYEETKRQAAELQTVKSELDKLRKEQKQAVDSQVNAKMREYQSELDKMEAKKEMIEDIVSRKKAYLDSMDSEVKRLEVHQSTINGVRLELVSLAAFLSDLDPISDPETIRRWLGLAGMCQDATDSIRMVFGPKAATIQKVA